MEISTESAYAFFQSTSEIIFKAAFILLLTAIAAHIVRKLLDRLLSRDGSPLPSSSIFTNLARAFVWICGCSIMLSTCFNFDLSAAITALGVGGIAISLGCQDTISNLVGGLQVSLTGIVTPGDFIEVSGKRGVVTDVNLRYTHIRTMAGDTIVIPNSLINSQAVVHLPPVTRIKVSLRIWNTSRDLDAVTHEILEAVKQQVAGIIVDPEQNTPRMVFTDNNDYTFGGVLTVNVEEGTDYLTAYDQALRAAAPYIVPEGANENV